MQPTSKVLITQNHLRNLAGSEIVTLELIEEFSKLAKEVHVVTNDFGDPLASLVQSFQNVRVFLESEQLALNLADYDLVWIQHQLIPTFVLDDLSRGKQSKFVFNHMSPHEPFEQPFLTAIEESLANLVLGNSQETLEKIESLFSKDMPTKVLANPAPSKFHQKPANASFSTTPCNVLVVSNHVPPELFTAIAKLRDNNISVQIIGAQGTPKRIEPGDIQSSDLVVTIGKTVQYALAAQKPVYCYDHFGGPGYLTPENFDSAFRKNFSGRSHPDKKTGPQIYEEIVGSFFQVQQKLESLQARIQESCLLSSELVKILDYLDTTEPRPHSLMDPAVVTSAKLSLALIRREYRNSQQTFALGKKIERLEFELNIKTEQLDSGKLAIKTLVRKMKARLLGATNNKSNGNGHVV